MSASACRRSAPAPEHRPIASPRIVALFGSRVVFGQERANIEALAVLRAKGCEILCVVRSEDWPELRDLRDRLTARDLRWQRVPFIDIPVRGWLLKVLLRNPFAFVLGNLMLVRIMRAFRATHIHAFNQFYTLNFWPVLALSRAKVVYRIGDLPILHNIIFRLSWRLVRRVAAHFVADSLFIKRAVSNAGVDPSRITVLYAPPPVRLDRDPVVLPPDFTRKGSFRFIYVGQLRAEKGLAILVAAFARVTERFPWALLLIAGPVPKWSGDTWAHDLRQQIQSNEILKKRIEFVGAVENVPDLLAKCHVHVCPTLTEEPYGLVVTEAKSAGLPSIVFPSGGLRELVEHDVDGLITPAKTQDDLEAALARYLAEPLLARTHGEAARRSLSKLRLDDFPRRWLDVYSLT